MGNSVRREQTQKSETERRRRQHEEAEKWRQQTEDQQRQRSVQLRALGFDANKTHWYRTESRAGLEEQQELLTFGHAELAGAWMMVASVIVPTAGGHINDRPRQGVFDLGRLEAKRIRAATADEIESWQVERRRGVECDLLCSDGYWRIGVIEEVGADSYTVSTAEDALRVRVPLYALQIMPLGSRADKRPPRLLIGADPFAKNPTGVASSSSSAASSPPPPSNSIAAVLPSSLPSSPTVPPPPYDA